MTNEIIRLQGLEKTYVTDSERLSVLRNLELSVPEGKKLVIVGESGSGKSTLLNILGGIDSATGGSVTVGGKEITALREDELSEYRSQYIGFIFQFHYLLKDFSALENVAMPALIAGVPKKEAVTMAEKLLSDVGLFERREHLPSQLSGGERQRVAVARSLINNPSLVLADEPTGNLDPENARLIGNLLFSLADKYRKTLLLVTHDLKLAANGDCCYRLQNGTLVPTELSE